MTWRVGEHYGIHVYDGNRPVATFHTEEDARRCVAAVTAQEPRPALYVNHPRTEPVAGDVVRDEDGDLWTLVDRSAYGELRAWHWSTTASKWLHNSPERVAGAVLLVDGETGQVVP